MKSFLTGKKNRLNSTKLNMIISISERKDQLSQLVIDASSIYVKLCFSGLFLIVVVALLILTQRALYSPALTLTQTSRVNK